MFCVTPISHYTVAIIMKLIVQGTEDTYVRMYALTLKLNIATCIYACVHI